MSWFQLMSQTFKSEKINIEKNKFIPKQFYCKSYENFSAIINEHLCLLLKDIQENKKIFILSDGVFKNSGVEKNANAEECVLQVLNKNFEVIHKNLSKEFNVIPEEIHASEYFLKKTSELINQESNCFVFIAFGSGTITDILKHALFLKKSESIFISIPTAMTVTAFTSAFSVVDIGGVKRTRESKNIDSTIWIEPLLKAAPMALSRAGYGDLLARFVAYGDWYLGYKLGIFEKYDELAYRLIEVFAEPLKKSSIYFGHEILSDEVTEIHAATLAMAGIAMSLSGETTPLSGYEHVISHGLDFLRLTSNRPLVLHGEQVALASLTSAMSYDWLLEISDFDIKTMRTLNDKEIEKIITQLIKGAPFFGVAETSVNINIQEISKTKTLFIDDYILKNNRWNLVKDKFFEFQQEWPEIKKYLSKITIRSSELVLLLENAKLPLYPEATTPRTSALEYRWALRFAPFIRTRFCIADFVFWIGEDPCIVAAI
jgi:glycerol-1-phosphate dehydrogenase [NAD(P)+]